MIKSLIRYLIHIDICIKNLSVKYKNDMLDKIFVLCNDKYPNRWLSIEKLLIAAKLTGYERVKCGHLEVVRKAIELEYKSIIVIEDDIKFDKTKAMALRKLPRVWQMITMFGMVHDLDDSPLYQINNRLLRTCYAIKSELFGVYAAMLSGSKPETALQMLLAKITDAYLIFPINCLEDTIHETEEVKEESKPKYEIICINLSAHTVRAESIATQFADAGIVGAQFHETCITDENKHMVKNFGEEDGAVAMSHYGTWSDLVHNTEVDFYVILSDTVKLCDEFVDKLERVVKMISDDHDMVYLGHSDGSRGDSEVKIVGLEEGRFYGGLYGYVLTKGGAAKLVDFVKANGIGYPIDLLIMANVDKLGMKMYEVVPALVK